MADDPMIGRVIGGHEIIEPIGAGGMGAVYRAVHLRLGQARAMKILPAALAADPVLVERFKREAQTAARLRHPNVVRIYDVGSEDGAHYIVMALVPGRSLLSVLRSEPLLGHSRSIRVLRQLAAALDAAHAAGIVHRDVKPSNVIVGEDDQVTLVDFGIASTLDATRLTQFGSLGTPAYMSPEQVRRQDTGPSFDLYALGVIAYEMLVGRPPFLGSDPLTVALAHRDELPPPPRTLRPDLPEAVSPVLLRQLAKSPMDRYASASEFVEALDGALTPAAPPPPPPANEDLTTVVSGPLVLPPQRSAARPVPAPATPIPSIPMPTQSPGRQTMPMYGAALAAGLALVTLGYVAIFGLRPPWAALAPTVASDARLPIANSLVLTPDAPDLMAALSPTVAPMAVPTATDPPTQTLTVQPTEVPTAEPTPAPTRTPTPPPAIVPENASRVYERGHIIVGSAVFRAVFSPDSQTVATISLDRVVRVWRTGDGALLRTLTGHTDAVTSVAFSPDGQIITSGSNDKTVRLWRASDGAQLRTLTGHTDAVRSVAFAPDGRTVASGSNDKTVRLWRASDGAQLRTLTGHTDVVTSVAFAPNSEVVASGSNDKTGRLWRTGDGTLLRTLTGHTATVSSVAFSPDGQTVASGSEDRAVRLWRASDGAVLRILTGHVSRVTSVAFSPDGQTVASGSAGFVARLWRAGDGAMLRTLAGHPDSVLSVAFSPDGRTIASASMDRTVRFWGVTDAPPPSPSPAVRPAASPSPRPSASPSPRPAVSWAPQWRRNDPS